MKKWLSAITVLSAGLMLAGCQPKEDPKELLLLSFDNATKTNGTNFSTDTKFSFDLSHLPEEDKLDKDFAHDFHSVNLKTDGGFDLKTKQSEINVDLSIPYKKDSLDIDFFIQADGKKKSVLVDNDKVLSSINSIWKLAKAYEYDKEIYKQEPAMEKQVKMALDWVNETFKKSYTTIAMISGDADDISVEYKDMNKDIRKFLKSIPSEYIQYDNNKHGHYANISISLTDKEIKELLKKEIKEKYKDEKEKEYLKYALQSEKEFEKAVTFETFSFNLIVDKDKYPVKLTTHIMTKVNNPDNKKEYVPFDLNSAVSFKNFDKPSFTEKDKNKKTFTEKEIQDLFEKEDAVLDGAGDGAAF